MDQRAPQKRERSDLDESRAKTKR